MLTGPESAEHAAEAAAENVANDEKPRRKAKAEPEEE
jgi:hypothetical protein